MKLTIELNEFEIIAFHEILDQIKEVIIGENEQWTDMYQTVISKVINQTRKQYNERD